jgi:pyruvate formate lyase activating enzyme
MDSDMNLTGRILEILRMSTEDGPGLRTTVFLKGCSLACDWCHNPESIESQPVVHWIDSRCLGCRLCVAACSTGSIEFNGRHVTIDRAACKACGKCISECPTTALEMLGSGYSVDSLVKEVLKDRTWFETSGGGVTVSGGEPLLQPEFVIRFLSRLRQEGIHTALDTSGHCSTSVLLECLEYTDLLLLDMKVHDDTLHRHHTGHGLARIRENIEQVANVMDAGRWPGTLWIRTPVIPGATMTRANIEAIGGWVGSLGSRVARWELCAFNNLCRDKYLRMQESWDYASQALLSQQQFLAAVEWARQSGVIPEIVIGSGPTSIDPERGVEG